MKTIEQLTLELIEQRGGSRMDSQDELLEFATRLLDKIAEQSEPVAWKDTLRTEHGDGMEENEPVLLGYAGWETLPDHTDLYLRPPKPDTEYLEALRKEKDYWEKNANEMNATWKKKLTHCRAVMEQAVEALSGVTDMTEKQLVPKAIAALRALLEEGK